MKEIEHSISRPAITDFMETAKRVIETSPQLNESNTKYRLIQPFIEDVLGWDRLDIQTEYGVQMGGQTYHVDYALLVNDIPEVFVEAKGLDTSIKETHVDQLQSYLKLQDVTWGVLTNGREYRVYQLDVDDGSSEFHLIAGPSHDELDRHRQALSAVSKPAVVSGESGALVETIRELNKAERTLQEKKSEISEAIVDIITDYTSTVIYQEAEQEAKELVDRLVDELKGEQPPESSTEPRVKISEGQDDFIEISLRELDGDDDALVGVYPSNESGIEFLSNFNAWGFISIAQKPDYFAIYVTRPHQAIKYFGVVDSIVNADEFVEIHDIGADEYQYDEGKKVVQFSTLYELTDSIPVGADAPARVQGLLYTTLGELKQAKSTDDL